MIMFVPSYIDLYSVFAHKNYGRGCETVPCKEKVVNVKSFCFL